MWEEGNPQRGARRPKHISTRLLLLQADMVDSNRSIFRNKILSNADRAE